MKIVSVAQMRALEAMAFASGISEAELQQRAGTAVAEEVFRLIAPGERVAALVGHGNNGRDGAVAAHWLLRHGTPVDLLLAPRHAVTPTELTSLSALGASITSSADTSAVASVLGGAHVALDALTGIGAKGALREPLASLARQLNEARRADLTVVALDLPSGVDADSGAVPGQAVQADWTVTLGAVKQGLLLFPAATRVGQLIGRELGLDDPSIRYVTLDEAELGRLVPERPPDAHKYRFGRVLAIAGSDQFLGAAVLCSGAAARVGAGLVTVAGSRDVRVTVASHMPEVTYTQADVRAADGASAAVALDGYLASHNSAVIGPGLGRSEATTAFVRTVLEHRPREHHLVVDADGLVALSEVPEWLRLVDPNVVLTPHSGELERLVGRKMDSSEPPWVQAGDLASRWNCVLVAKGPFTCVANPDGRVAVWPRSNPALATGGTGDVLAGTIAGLVAQGLQAWDAARLGVGVHGLAGERVVVQRQWRTLLASDLLSELPRVLAELIRRR